MKRILSFILTLSILISSLCIFAKAYEVDIKGEITDNPVIIVPGYTAAWLMYGDDPETAENAWSGLNFNEVFENLKDHIFEAGLGVALMNFDHADLIGKVIAKEMKRTWPLMKVNPDGTSVYDLKPYYFDAKDTTTKNLKEIDAGFSRHDRENAGIICDYVGDENVYNFNVDWRMGVEYCANKLNEYVQSVKLDSGKDKVNILAISQGGQIVSTYLCLYGENGDVDNVVMSSPAIGGSNLSSDLLSGNVDIDEQEVMRMIEHGMFMEEDYEWLFRANELGFLDDLIASIVHNLSDSMAYWGSIWDFVPIDKYEDLKKQYLSSPESAPLVKQSDRFHYEIQPKFTEKFRKLQSEGVSISIITGTGDKLLSGSNVYSDGVIPVSSATGATCAPYGQRFTDGYVQKTEWYGKNKVSPDMLIDASTCYLPDNTWFSEHNFHGWTWFSDCTKELALTLLLTDRIKDVYSDPDHPQFLYSDNLSESISFDLNTKVSGFVDGETNMLTVKNVLKDSNLNVLAVYCPELNLKFKVDSSKVLSPGKSVDIPVKGTIPQVSNKCIHITVYYKADTKTPLNYKTKGYTIMNGESVEMTDGLQNLDDGGILTNIKMPSIKNILHKLGLYEIVSMLFTVFYCRIINLV